MIKILFSILFISFTAAVAGEQRCDSVGTGEAYRSIAMQEVVVCFVYAKASDLEKGQLSASPSGMYIYSISKLGKLALVHELPYAGTKGKINDAFLYHVDGVEALFVIHSIETPRSWDPVSDVYDVTVIKLQDGALAQDPKLSRFFGMGGDFVDSHGRLTYIYPYKDRAAIEQAIRSPEFQVAASTLPVKGVIKEKTFLYEGESEPAMQSNMYLVSGDQVTVKDSLAGWCKVLYAAKAKPITKWMQCKMIFFPRTELRPGDKELQKNKSPQVLDEHF